MFADIIIDKDEFIEVSTMKNKLISLHIGMEATDGGSPVDSYDIIVNRGQAQKVIEMLQSAVREI